MAILQGRRDAPPQDGGGGQGGQGGGGGGMEFDSWRHQTHQPPSAAFNHMSSTMDPYMSSFYGSQYFPGYGVGDGTWSNGGDPAMTFLGNYGQGMQVCVLLNPTQFHNSTLSSFTGSWRGVCSSTRGTLYCGRGGGLLRPSNHVLVRRFWSLRPASGLWV